MSLNLEVEVDVPFTLKRWRARLSLLPSTMKVFLMRRK